VKAIDLFVWNGGGTVAEAENVIYARNAQNGDAFAKDEPAEYVVREQRRVQFLDAVRPDPFGSV
jgi:hypothetical protein